VNLRDLADTDLAALAALFRGTPAQLGRDLRDGREVVVAARGEEIAGCAATIVAGSDGFGAPVLATDPGTAMTLVGHVVERCAAGGAARIRISAFPDEVDKLAALRAHGFAPVFDFVTVARAPGGEVAPAPRLQRLGYDRLDPARFAEAYNACFADVPNAPPLSAAQMAHDLAAPTTDRALTCAWGDYDGLVLAERDRDARGTFVDVTAIGARVRRQGLGGAILDDLLARVTGVDEVRALIATTNAASLALFTARGFVEHARRTVYEKLLTAA
jgi:ribosomal protein S18 acetylase RimI-like enzyme